MNEQNMQRLWNNLRTRDKNFTRTYAQFKTDMQDEGNRRRLHSNLQSRGGLNRSWDEFNSDMGFGDTSAVRKEEGRRVAEQAKATPTPVQQQQTQQQPAGFQMPGLFNPNSNDPAVRAMHERLKQQDMQRAKETNTIPAQLTPMKIRTNKKYAPNAVSPERKSQNQSQNDSKNNKQYDFSNMPGLFNPNSEDSGIRALHEQAAGPQGDPYVEKQEPQKQDSYGRDLYESVMAGLGHVAQLPYTAVGAFEDWGSGLAEKLSGGYIPRTHAMRDFMNEYLGGNYYREATKHYEKESDRYHDNKGIIESMREGDWGKAFGKMGLGVAKNVPNLAASVGLTLTGNPELAASSLAGMASFENWEEIADDDSLTDEQKAISVLGTFLSEYLFERLGDQRIQKMFQNGGTATVKKELAQGANNAWKKFVSTKAVKGLGRTYDWMMKYFGESITEMCTEASEQSVDIYLGRRDGFDWNAVGDAGAVAFASDAPMQMVSGVRNRYSTRKVAQEVNGDATLKALAEKNGMTPEEVADITTKAARGEEITEEQDAAFKGYLDDIRLLNNRSANMAKLMGDAKIHKDGDGNYMYGTIIFGEAVRQLGLNPIEVGDMLSQEYESAKYKNGKTIWSIGRSSQDEATVQAIKEKMEEVQKSIDDGEITVEALAAINQVNEDVANASVAEDGTVQPKVEAVTQEQETPAQPAQEQTQAAPAVTPETTVEGAQEQDKSSGKAEEPAKPQDIERTVDVNINGTITPITIKGMKMTFEEDGSIDFDKNRRVYLIGPNKESRGSEEDKAAVNDYLRQEKLNNQMPELQDVPIAETPVVETPVAETPIEQSEVVPEAQEEQMPVEQRPYPVLEDGTPDFSNMTPEQQVAYTMEIGGEEAVAEMVQTEIARLNKKLKKAENNDNLNGAQLMRLKMDTRQQIAEWEQLMPAQPQPIEENAENLQNNLVESEKNSNFAQNSESNDKSTNRQGAGESGRDSGIQGNNDSRIPQTAVAEGANRAGSEEGNGRPGQPLSAPNTDGNGPGVSGGIGDNVVSEEREKNSLFSSLLERLGFNNTTKQPVVQVTGEYFHRVFSEAQPTIKNGWMVSVHPVESSDGEIGYNDCKCYMTADGKSGVAVAPDGDIISLWSAADKSDGTRVEKLIGWAIENGGRKCDCYANGLHGLYGMFGGKPISQTPFNEDFAPDGWDGKRGPVVTFIFPETAEESLTTYANHREQGMTVRKMSDQTNISPDAVPEFTDDETGYGYDKAMRYRDQVLSGEINPEQTEEPAAEQEDPNTPINLQGNGIAILLHNVADDKLPLVKVARVTEEDGQKVYREIGTDKVLSTEGGYWNEMEKQVVNQGDTDYINIKYREGQRKRLGIPAEGTAADYAALNAQNEFRPSVEEKLPNRGLTTLTKDAKSVTVGAFDNKSMDDLLETPFITGLGGIGKVFTLKDLLSLAPKLVESSEGRQKRKTIWNQVYDWCEETALRSLKLTRGDDYSEKDVNELRNYLKNQIKHSIPQAMEMWNNIVKKYNIDELFSRTIADENGAEIPVIDLIDPRVLDAYWMLRKAIYGEKKEGLPTLIFPMKNRYEKDGWYNPPKNPEHPMGEDANIFRYMQTVVQLAVELQDVVEEIDGLEPFLNTDRNNSFPYYKTVEDARIKKGAKDIESEYKEVMKKIEDAETVKDLLSVVQHPKGWQKKNDIWFDEDGKHVADNPEYNKDYAADVEEALTIKAEELGVRLGRLVKEETDSEGLSEEELLAQEAAMSDMGQEDGIGVESENTEESARKAAEADMKAEAEGELSQKTILLQLISEKEKEHEEAMARLEEFLLNKKDGMANDIEAINKKIENARSHKNTEQVQYLESLIDGVRTRYRDTEKKLKEKVNDVGRELAQLNDRIQFEIGGEMDTTERGRRAAEREVEILKNAGIKVEVISEADLGSVIGEKRMQELKDSKGVVYGVSDGQQIWLIGERMNPNTPVHEYGHLFVESYAQKHPAEWKKAIELLKKTDMWQRVANDKQYANIKGNEHEMASEVFSRLLGAYYGETDMFDKTRLEDSFEQKGLVAKVTSLIRKVLREIADIFEYKLNPRSKDYNRQIRELMEKSIGELAGIETTEDTNQRFQAESESNLTAEEQRIKADAEKNGTFMTAPNGQPTNLNEKQWLQVRTKNFINWFGDWLNDPANASKALDENGEPKIFYRGTAQPQTVLTSKYQSGAIWFTDDIEVARFYAQRRNDYQMTEEEIEANVQPVYLNMRDVAEFDSEGRRWEEAVTEPVYFIIDDDGVMVYMSRDRAEVESYCQEHGLDPDVEIEESTTTGDVADVELMSGKDGVAFNNVIDGALKVANVRVVKDSSQAKSAVYNNGEFNPENKDIRFHVESESDLDLLTDDKEPTQPAAQMSWLQRKVNAALDQSNGIRLMLKRIGEVEGKKVAANEDVRDILERKRSVKKNLVERFENHEGRLLGVTVRDIEKTIKKKGMWKKGMTDWYSKDGGVQTKDNTRELTARKVLEMYLMAKDTLERIQFKIPVRDVELPFRLLQYLGLPIDTPLETKKQREEVMQKMVDTFEAKIGKEQIDALWKSINECTDFALKTLLDGELLGENKYAEFKKRKFYVPERGFAQLESNDEVRKSLYGNEPKGVKKIVAKAIDKKAKGGKSMATDVLTHILYIAEDAIICSEENKIRLAALDLMGNHSEACKKLGYPKPKKVWYVRTGFNEDGSPQYEAQIEKPLKETIDKNNKVLELIKGYREDLEMFKDIPALKKEVEQRIEEAKKERLIVPRKDAGDAVDLSRSELAGQEIPKVLVSAKTEDGDVQQYTMEFPNQPEIANALNGVIDKRWSNSYVNNIGHFFSANYTARDPLFWTRNFPADVIMVTRKGVAERGIAYPAFLATELALVHKSIVPLIAHVLNIDIDSIESGKPLAVDGWLERDFRKFLDGGGNTGYTQLKGIEDFRKEADRLIDGRWTPRGIAKLLFSDIATGINEFFELYTRFAVYLATKDSLAAENKIIRTLGSSPVDLVRKLGRSVSDLKRTTEYTEEEIEAMALHDALNFSGNFNRQGAGGFINFFNSISMFANASIQGAMSVYRTFEQGEWQKGIRGAISLMIVPALVGYILTALSPDDDDDKEGSVAEYIRQNFLVFLDKKIRLPYDLVPWYRIGVNYALMEQQRISKTDGIENIAMGFAEHAMPVPPAISEATKTLIDWSIPETDFRKEDPELISVINATIQAQFMGSFIELEHGKSWTGSDLRYKYAKDKPQWMFQEYEPELYKDMSKGAYRLPGGSMKEPSITIDGKKMGHLADASPKQIKTFCSSLTSEGCMKIACYLWGIGKEQIFKDGVDYVRNQDVPIVSTFELGRDADMSRIGISAEMSAMIREAKENYTRVPGLRGMDERDAAQRIKLWDKTHKDYTQVRLKKDELKKDELSKYKDRLEQGYGIKIDGDSADDLLHAYIVVMTSEQCKMKGLDRTIKDMERWKSKYKDVGAIRQLRYGR